MGENERAAIVRAIDNRAVAVLPWKPQAADLPAGRIAGYGEGQGRVLQRYRDASLADLTTFAMADGLSWRAGRGMRTESRPAPVARQRGQIGHAVPLGFPLSNRFEGKKFRGSSRTATRPLAVTAHMRELSKAFWPGTHAIGVSQAAWRRMRPEDAA